jgi:hypothetical protein
MTEPLGGAFVDPGFGEGFAEGDGDGEADAEGDVDGDAETGTGLGVDGTSDPAIAVARITAKPPPASVRRAAGVSTPSREVQLRARRTRIRTTVATNSPKRADQAGTATQTAMDHD